MIDMKTKFVAVLVFDISPDDMSGAAREATLVIQRREPLLHGFIEGIVMASEDRKQLLVVTQWESRESWAHSRWNEDVERALSDIIESATTFQVHTYEPITVVRAS
jgi:heme-degrading monooxygenase HmoA